MEKLKEQYDTELQALRESVEEAAQVSPPTGRSVAGVGMGKKMWLGNRTGHRSPTPVPVVLLPVRYRVKLSSWK